MQSKTVHEIVPFRFRLLLSSNDRSGIKREHSHPGELSSSDDDDNFDKFDYCVDIDDY